MCSDSDASRPTHDVDYHFSDPNRSDKLVCAVDLQMLVALVGREDATAQFQALYDAAGVRLTRSPLPRRFPSR